MVRKASTISSIYNARSLNPVIVAHNLTKAVDMKILVGVVLLSVSGDNFVLAKVCLGLISVCCSEMRGVHFSEVRNVLFYGKINEGQVIYQLYGGCPLFGGSVIRGFTVLVLCVC